MYDPVTMKLNVEPLIISALREDITSEDVSTNCVMPGYKEGTVDLICKEDGVICGLQVFERVFTLLDEKTKAVFSVSDGDLVEKGQQIGTIKGDIRVLLSGERTALNYSAADERYCHHDTRRMAELLEGTGIQGCWIPARPRRTTRIFEKYAVRRRVAAMNHRYNLSDGSDAEGQPHRRGRAALLQAVQRARDYAPFVRKIEVEAENAGDGAAGPGQAGR